MKESYGEGLASHTGPESWGYGGNGVSVGSPRWLKILLIVDALVI